MQAPGICKRLDHLECAHREGKAHSDVRGLRGGCLGYVEGASVQLFSRCLHSQSRMCAVEIMRRCGHLGLLGVERCASVSICVWNRKKVYVRMYIYIKFKKKIENRVSTVAKVRVMLLPPNDSSVAGLPLPRIERALLHAPASKVRQSLGVVLLNARPKCANYQIRPFNNSDMNVVESELLCMRMRKRGVDCSLRIPMRRLHTSFASFSRKFIKHS